MQILQIKKRKLTILTLINIGGGGKAGGGWVGLKMRSIFLDSVFYSLHNKLL